MIQVTTVKMLQKIYWRRKMSIINSIVCAPDFSWIIHLDEDLYTHSGCSGLSLDLLVLLHCNYMYG